MLVADLAGDDGPDTAHLAVVRDLTRRNGGEMSGATGNRTTSLFGSAVDAVRTAVAVQQAAQRAGRDARAGLAIGDLLYRRSNLEHAAASLENVMQALVLIALLCVPVMAYATPTLRLGWIHPLTLLIPLLYGSGWSSSGGCGSAAFRNSRITRSSRSVRRKHTDSRNR